MDKNDNNLKVVSTLMSIMMKAGGLDVTRPEEMLLEDVNKLTPNAQDVWTNINIDFQRLSLKEAKALIKLMIHKYYSTLEILDNVRMELSNESKDTMDFVMAHEEYRQKSSEDDLRSLIEGALDSNED